ncbi:MAG: hypothetical protein AAF586_01745 [Planctomycetota bacterium]
MPAKPTPTPPAVDTTSAAPPDSPRPHHWLVWADAERIAPVSALVDTLGDAIAIAGVGGSRDTTVAQFAKAHDTALSDDLRALIASTEVDGLLIASAEGVGPTDLALAVDNGVEVRATELPLTNLADLRTALGTEGGPKGESPLIITPAVARLPGLAKASDPMQTLGDPRAVHVRHVGPSQAGTVWTRLVDAWLAVLTFGAMPETIDATLRSAAARQPDDPLAVHGTVLAHGRGLKSAAATVVVSDQAIATRRRLEVFAAHGTLELTDHAFLVLADGDPPVDGTPDPHTPADPADLLADHWRQLDTQPESHPKLARLRQAVACGLATLLSARTAQPESPHSLLEIDR